MIMTIFPLEISIVLAISSPQLCLESAPRSEARPCSKVLNYLAKVWAASPRLLQLLGMYQQIPYRALGDSDNRWIWWSRPVSRRIYQKPWFCTQDRFFQGFRIISPPCQSIESHVLNWWPDPADNFLVRSAAAGLKVLQPQRWTSERLRVVSQVDQDAEWYISYMYIIYIYISLYLSMCFSIIDINIYMCTKAPIFSITHLCARMNVEDCLPEKITNSLFTNHLPLTIIDVEGYATPKRSQSG